MSGDNLDGVRRGIEILTTHLFNYNHPAIHPENFSRLLKEEGVSPASVITKLIERGVIRIKSEARSGDRIYYFDQVDLAAELESLTKEAPPPLVLSDGETSSGENQGGDDESDDDKQTKVASLPPRVRLAYLAAQYAELKKECKLSDPDAWQYLKENGIEGAGELDNYKLPPQGTFADYMTEARRAMGEKRKSPRGGRTGRSIIRPTEM